MNQKKWIFSLFCFTFTLAITQRKHPKWDVGRGFVFKAFIKSEQLRRLLNDQNDWYNVLGNSRWFWKKNRMTPLMAYSVSVWFISATNGCYESDDISLKWIPAVIPSRSVVIFYPNQKAVSLSLAVWCSCKEHCIFLFSSTVVQ